MIGYFIKGEDEGVVMMGENVRKKGWVGVIDVSVLKQVDRF